MLQNNSCYENYRLGCETDADCVERSAVVGQSYMCLPAAFENFRTCCTLEQFISMINDINFIRTLCILKKKRKYRKEIEKQDI